MAECEFCDALWLYKFSDRELNKLHVADGEPRMFHEYTVAIVRRSWTKARGKRHAGRSTDYRHLGLGFKLNYCPECGKALRRKEDG